MKIYSDGKSRVLSGAFPKHFRLLNGDQEVPFIRTGNNSVRLSGVLPVGDLMVEEIVRQKTAQPAKLDAASLAIINKQDFDRIDILNKKLAINQEKMGEQMNAMAEHEATLANLETKNANDIELLSGQTAAAVQMLKGAIEDSQKENAGVQRTLGKMIAERTGDVSDELLAHENASNPHRITKATVGLSRVEDLSPDEMPVSKAVKGELDKKADKKTVDDLDEKIKKATKANNDLQKGVERLVGGIGGLELPSGGEAGQVLTKGSDKTGDYVWRNAGSVGIHNELAGRDAANAHPISAITGLQTALDGKYDASNPDGFISGITSTDVTNALGYTPYNATNPSKYQTDQEVATAVGTETTNRENADNALQQQIDGITASSDVKDIVGTYAALQAYDTSTLGNNDIIKVLQDETHSDETTYYRWNTTSETFTLIGEEGPYYTKSEANSTFVPQTRTVNGKALSADISLTYSDVGALPDSTVIPTVNNGTLKIQKNGTDIATFTANSSTNETANITVPTDTGDLTNGAGYITGITYLMVTTALGYTPADQSSLADYVTIAGDETITGGKTFTKPVNIQNGNGTGALIFGADVNASTIGQNTRKLGRINSPTYGSKTLTATLLGWDTSGDSDMHTANKSQDAVCFGGMKKITTNSSPMNIVFCVNTERNATAANKKVYALEMDANEARFNVQPNYNGTALATTSDIPTNYVTTDTAQTVSGAKTFSSDVTLSNKAVKITNSDGNTAQYNARSIEFMPTTTSTNGGYIDFHYAGDQADNTSRIIEDATGVINVNGSKFSKTAPATLRIQPTDTTTTSLQADTVGARNTALSTKQDDLTTITGYDATKKQVLCHEQGVLKWVDDFTYWA